MMDGGKLFQSLIEEGKSSICKNLHRVLAVCTLDNFPLESLDKDECKKVMEHRQS